MTPLAEDRLVAERFQLQRWLPSGRLGELWLATDGRTGETVTLRFLSPYLDRTRGFRTAFLRAAESLCRLDHPSIVRGLACGTDERDRPLLVCEHVPGASLRQPILQRAPIPASDAARLGTDIATALGWLHRRGILHGDLRPSAVVMAPGRGCVLLDPGMPEPFTRDGDEISPRLATRAYRSRHGRPSVHDDLYGAAAVVYALVLGRDPGRDLSDLPDRVPARLAATLAPALSLHPTARYASADELAAALWACAQR